MASDKDDPAQQRASRTCAERVPCSACHSGIEQQEQRKCQNAGLGRGETNALILLHLLVPCAAASAWSVVNRVHKFDTLCLVPDTPAVLGCVTLPPRKEKASPRRRPSQTGG